MTNDQRAEAPETEILPVSVSFQEFLQSIPPGQTRNVVDFAHGPERDKEGVWLAVQTPPLQLHCEHCDGVRQFRTNQSPQMRGTGSCYLD